MNDEEYRKKLTPEQYEVTRLKATERPFTGKYHDTKDPGVYVCICCEQNLFSSEAIILNNFLFLYFLSPINFMLLILALLPKSTL